MYARALQEAEAQLVEVRHDELHRSGLSGLALGASFTATAVCPPLVFPLFVGGLTIGVAGICAMWRHWDLVDRLADDHDAYVIPEVQAYAARDARMERRVHYAALVRRWARTRDSSIAGLGEQLEGLIRELEDATLELDPSAALACRRLLTEPTVSPLFDDLHDTEDLRSCIAQIRAGFRPRT
jgi:hypothetical protein